MLRSACPAPQGRGGGGGGGHGERPARVRPLLARRFEVCLAMLLPKFRDLVRPPLVARGYLKCESTACALPSEEVPILQARRLIGCPSASLSGRRPGRPSACFSGHQLRHGPVTQISGPLSVPCSGQLSLKRIVAAGRHEWSYCKRRASYCTARGLVDMAGKRATEQPLLKA